MEILSVEGLLIEFGIVVISGSIAFLWSVYDDLKDQSLLEGLTGNKAGIVATLAMAIVGTAYCLGFLTIARYLH